MFPANSTPPSNNCTRHAASALVGTLEWRHGLALLGVQGVALDRPEGQVDLAVGLALPCQSVLHPVLIITLGVVLAGVGTTGLLAVSSRDGGLSAVNSSVQPFTFIFDNTYAQVSKLRSSRVSVMSVFQIMPRSLVPIWLYSWSMAATFSTPSSKLS